MPWGSGGLMLLNNATVNKVKLFFDIQFPAGRDNAYCFHRVFGFRRGNPLWLPDTAALLRTGIGRSSVSSEKLTCLIHTSSTMQIN